MSTSDLLYISERVPYRFTFTAMVAFMRTEGLSLEQFGTFVAALFLPWAFKWVWAPLIDLVKLRRIGGRKAWILFCTTMMILTLLITASVDFVANFQLLLLMIVRNNFFCATQDAAIDSLAVSTLKEGERGRGNGFMLLTGLPTLVLAAQISNVGLEFVPIDLFYAVIILHGLFYAMVLYLDALIAIVPLAVIPFLRNREEEPGLAALRDES